MVSVAVWVLTVAVVAGTTLALWHMRAIESGSRPPVLAGIAHGVVGAAGLAALLLALQGPPRAVLAGAGSFGTTSAVLFAAALLTGVLLFLLRRSPVIMVIHAGIAITAFVLLLAWSSLS